MSFTVTKHLLQKIATSLLEDVSDNNRKTWSEFIIKNKVPVVELVSLVFEQHPVGMRFMWMIGHIADTHPSVLLPAARSFFEVRHKVTFAHYERSLAKLFYYAGIPVEIEGKVIDELFKWLVSSESDVSTRTFAVMALQRAANKYPDLKPELKAVIEDQLSKNSISFQKKAKKILSELS